VPSAAWRWRPRAALGLPLVEDNPYGDLWFDAPPPPPLAARWAEGGLPGLVLQGAGAGLRLGYVVAPPALYPKLLQAKQAADLHTPGFNQRVVHEVIKDGFLRRSTCPPSARATRRSATPCRPRCSATCPPGCRWRAGPGRHVLLGRAAEGMDATALLPQAVDAGMAYVPGRAFFARRRRMPTRCA
jgi:2-aminoadipate transaminase